MSCECGDNENKESKICKKGPTLRVNDLHHRVGLTVPFKDNFYDTISQPVARSCHTVQFYMGPTTEYKCSHIDSFDKRESVRYCDANGKTIYIHCPNNTNLARDPNHNIATGSSYIIKKEVKEIKYMPAACIAHIGAKGTVENVVRNINNLNIQRGQHHRMEKQLLLENSAGAGSQIGKDWTELRKIFEGVDKNTVGLCIDTQHIFGAGTCKLDSHESVVQMFDKVNEVYGNDPDVIHLNDSKVGHGDKTDRHWSIGYGYIWHQEDEGLRTLLGYCYDNDIDVILETPTSGYDLEKIRTDYMDTELIETVKYSDK